MASLLPPHPGLLPNWLLLVSIISLANSVQAYSTLTFTRRVYSGTTSSATSKSTSANASASPVTPLSARTFGTWTFLSSVVRLYAAYHISQPAVYQLALWTYLIAFFHFLSEWLVYGSTSWGKGLAGPVGVATGSLVWMLMQWGSYVQ